MSYEKKRKTLEKFAENYGIYNSATSSTIQNNARIEMNLALPFVIDYLHSAGISTTIYYSPPPMLGGMAGNIDVFANIFQMHLLRLQFNPIPDMLIRGIGVYDYKIEILWKQRLNPLYWIGELIRLPFKLISFSGFNGTKLEFSFIGKTYKLMVSSVAVIVGMIEIYKFAKPILSSRYGITLP